MQRARRKEEGAWRVRRKGEGAWRARKREGA